MNRWAALQGPSVWLLDGPTPILNMSNTEMDSCGKEFEFLDFDKDIQKKPPWEWGLLAGSSWLLHIKQMYIKIGMDETN